MSQFEGAKKGKVWGASSFLYSQAGRRQNRNEKKEKGVVLERLGE